MSELISGKEAFDKAYDGELVEYLVIGCSNWCDFNKEDWGVSDLKSGNYKFRLKPRTITLNNIEIPAPFEPKEGDKYWHIDTDFDGGYGVKENLSESSMQLGAWRTEEEIKQVVSALRSVFKGGVI
ncbi:MAG: hypothetical protein RSE38_00775 [Acinetobacter sp.]